MWDIAAFSTDASEILENLDLLCTTFGFEVGFKEYVTDFYDFCRKLAETRDNYTLGEHNSENISKLRSVFELVGLLTVAEEVSDSTNPEDARAVYDALMLSVDNELFREKFQKTEQENPELFDSIYTGFLTIEKSLKTIDDFMSLMESLYNENKQNIVLELFKNLTHISETAEVLTDSDNVSVLGIGELIEKYEKLKSKTTVHQAVYKKEFTSVESFTETLEKAINKAEKEDDESENEKPKKNNKGGGGSSGGFSANAAAIGSTVKPAETTVVESEFNDLEGYDWAKEQIDLLYKNGVINGKSKGVFDPSGSVLREEAVKMIVEAFDIAGTGAKTEFDDVHNSAWYADYVYTAKNFGITKGISSNLFGTGLSITRQDAAVMIYTALLKKGIIEKYNSGSISFVDESDIAAYAGEAVGYMNFIGAITGYTDGSFKPGKTISRAEFAVILGKVCRLLNS